MSSLTPVEIETLLATGDMDALHDLDLLTSHPFYTFQPRRDRPTEFDEQTAFLQDTQHSFNVLLGGTGSGKTAIAALKTARYLLNTPPPVEQCPFWVIGEFLEQICQVAWVEKLSHFIPESEILDVHWWQSKRRWPRSVTLRHPTKRERPGWILEFKSYEQGIGSMKAVSIGGYWFNEEVPYHIVFEVQGRCRDYSSPGWADFTPIECKWPQWIEAYQSPPEGWKFYHLNVLCNHAKHPNGKETVAEWATRYLKTVPEDERELRTIGKFTVLRGSVFKEFRRAVHVVEPFRIPKTWRRLRGIDFGCVNAFVVIWVAVNNDGRYFVYDEYYSQRELLDERVKAINGRDPAHEPYGSQAWHGPTFSDHDAQWRMELGNRGIHCTPAHKDILAGVSFLRSLMIPADDGEPRVLVFEHCHNLIREIIGYRWPEGTDTRNPREQPVDKDNDTVDALRYAIYSDQLRGGETRPFGMRVQADNASRGVQLTKRR